MKALICALTLAAFLAPASASAAVFKFRANLDGASESPPVASLGTGTAIVFFDDVLHQLTVDIDFAGLTGTTTVAHIHAPTAVAFTGTVGVASQTPTFAGFPAGVTSGSYFNVFDTTLASTFNAPFVTANGGTAAGAEAALVSAMETGRAYVNIHTSFSGSGEIRGFLTPVPEPSAWTMMILGFGALGYALRRQRRPAPVRA